VTDILPARQSPALSGGHVVGPVVAQSVGSLRPQVE
jgi:hypothetical protein